MKRNTTLVFVLFTLASFAPPLFKDSPVEQDQGALSVYFEGCFQNDMITVEINNVRVVSNYKVVSKKGSEQTSNLSLVQLSDQTMAINFNDKRKQVPGIKFGKTVQLDIWINGVPHSFKFNSKKGTLFFVDYCSPVPGKARIITIKQEKEEIISSSC